MNERERFMETLLFGKPDKIPFSPGGPRESTLKRWRREGLPSGRDWYEFLLQELGVTKETGQTPVGLDVSFSGPFWQLREWCGVSCFPAGRPGQNELKKAAAGSLKLTPMAGN